MSTQPVDDHSEEFEQLAGLVALRVLEGEELDRFEQHAAHCEQCRLMLRLDREALARLSLAARLAQFDSLGAADSAAAGTAPVAAAASSRVPRVSVARLDARTWAL